MRPAMLLHRPQRARCLEWPVGLFLARLLLAMRSTAHDLGRRMRGREERLSLQRTRRSSGSACSFVASCALGGRGRGEDERRMGGRRLQTLVAGSNDGSVHAEKKKTCQPNDTRMIPCCRPPPWNTCTVCLFFVVRWCHSTQSQNTGCERRKCTIPMGYVVRCLP